MSYKFQRLREKLRHAIASGELSGKLPGERALARRFHVNAKTLSKALTDLAAEGVLDRSIGRGTYVKGQTPAPSAAAKRWLVLCDPEDADSCLVRLLKAAEPDLHIATDVADMRPSFLGGISAVIDFARATPEAFLRDLVVRNLPVVAVGREARTYSMNAVLVDVALAASRLGRDLLLAGHRRLLAVEERGGTAVSHALRQAASRYAPDAVVEACAAAEAGALLDQGDRAGNGPTAIVCQSNRAARRVRGELARLGVDAPGRVSLAAVGCTCDDCQCSGYFVDCAQLADGAVRLLREAPTRPATLWLAGDFVDRGTTGPTAATFGGADHAGTSSGASTQPPSLRLGGVLV